MMQVYLYFIWSRKLFPDKIWLNPNFYDPVICYCKFDTFRNLDTFLLNFSSKILFIHVRLLLLTVIPNRECIFSKLLSILSLTFVYNIIWDILGTHWQYNFWTSGTGVVSFTNPPIISGPGPENNGPPPLTLGPEVELCWLLSLTLEPSADMHLSPSTLSPDRNIFN